MSPSSADLLRQVKSEIEEIDPSEVKELLQRASTIVDVRETEELASGLFPAQSTCRAPTWRRVSRGSCPTAPPTSSSTAPPATARLTAPARSNRTSATSTSSR